MDEATPERADLDRLEEQIKSDFRSWQSKAIVLASLLPDDLDAANLLRLDLGQRERLAELVQVIKAAFDPPFEQLFADLVQCVACGALVEPSDADAHLRLGTGHGGSVMTSEPMPTLGYTYELEDELRNLRSAVWRMVSEVEENVGSFVTTEGGDIIRLLDFEAAAVRRALEANEPGTEGR